MIIRDLNTKNQIMDHIVAVFSHHLIHKDLVLSETQTNFSAHPTKDPLLEREHEREKKEIWQSVHQRQGWGSPETLQMVFHCSVIWNDFSLKPKTSLKSDMRKFIIHQRNAKKLGKYEIASKKTITRKMSEQRCTCTRDQKEIKDGYQSQDIRNTDQLFFITPH